MILMFLTEITEALPIWKGMPIFTPNEPLPCSVTSIDVNRLRELVVDLSKYYTVTLKFEDAIYIYCNDKRLAFIVL